MRVHQTGSSSKVAKPENRVNLRSLDYFAEQGLLYFKLPSLKEEENSISSNDIATWYAKSLLAIRSTEDAAKIRRTIFQAPVRSGLQVLGGAVSLLQQESTGAVLTEKHLEKAADALRHVAQTSLAKHGLHLDDMRRGAGEMLSSRLAEWLTRTRQWKTMARLQPQFSDEDRNMVAIAAAAVHVEVFRSRPAAMFEYWLRIALIRETLELGSTDNQGLTATALMEHLSLDTQESAIQTVARLNAFESGNGKQLSLAIRLSGANVPSGRIKEYQSAFQSLYGVLPPNTREQSDGFIVLDGQVFANALSGDAARRELLIKALPPAIRGYHLAVGIAEGAKGVKGAKGAASAASKDRSRYAHGLESLRTSLDAGSRALLAASSFQIVSGQASEHGAVSVLRLIALLGMLIEALPGNQKAEADVEFVRRFLDSIDIDRAYPTRGGDATALAVDTETNGTTKSAGVRRIRKIRSLSENEEETAAKIIDKKVPQDTASLDRLSVALADWLACHRKRFQRQAVAPVTLSRMMTRFVYAFGNINQRLMPFSSRYLGVLMNRALRVFLHAVAVETLKTGVGKFPPSANSNPVTSGENFSTLLDYIYGTVAEQDSKNDHVANIDIDPELRFFDLIFSCPIWAYFLARSDNWEDAKTHRWDASEVIFTQYSRRLAMFMSPADKADFPSVTLNLESVPKELKFNSLFFPLNTVYLQGETRKRRNLDLEKWISASKAAATEMPDSEK